MNTIPSRPKALIFDVFGTICDWRSGVAAEAAKFFSDKKITFDPVEFADLWRGEYQPAMQRIRSGNRGYISLDTLHRENLDLVLEKTGLADHFEAHERDAFNHAWEKLPTWPDVPDALNRLREKHFLAPCSNGSIALMVRLARFAGLSWDTVLGAELARNYKPEHVVYMASCAAIGLKPAEVMMVAAHNDDLAAAQECGLMTAFFARPREYGPDQKTDLTAEGDWDFIAKDLQDLANRLND